VVRHVHLAAPSSWVSPTAATLDRVASAHWGPRHQPRDLSGCYGGCKLGLWCPGEGRNAPHAEHMPCALRFRGKGMPAFISINSAIALALPPAVEKTDIDRWR